MHTRASTARVAPSTPDPVPALLALVGDPLECTRALRGRPETECFPELAQVWGRHRGAVVGVDLSRVPTRSDVRSRLRRVADDCEELCRRLRALEHIILLVHGTDALAEEGLLRDGDAAARRIHARLEQECGRSIIVTALLVDGCDDHAVLADRVATRARQAESLDVGIALRWEDIVRAPIGAVAANDYV